MKFLRFIGRVLRWLWWQIDWVIYYRMTIWDRNAYDASLSRGMRHVEAKPGFLYNSTLVTFDPTRPPYRNFLNYKEYMELKRDGK